MQFTEFGRQNTIQGPDDSGLNDFLFRRYSSTQSRWISPDPAGIGAVDPTNPQTWNRYAYVANNPLSATDPLGLRMTVGFDNDGGGGYDDGYCPPEYENCGEDIGIGIGIAIDGGDGWSGSLPAPGLDPGPLGRNADWPNETLGLPGDLRLQPLSLVGLLGLAPGTECDFGVCAPIAYGYLAGVVGDGTSDSPWIYQVIVSAPYLRVFICGDFLCNNNGPGYRSHIVGVAPPEVRGLSEDAVTEFAIAGLVTEGPWLLNNNPILRIGPGYIRGGTQILRVASGGPRLPWWWHIWNGPKWPF